MGEFTKLDSSGDASGLSSKPDAGAAFHGGGEGVRPTRVGSAQSHLYSGL